MWGDSDLAGCRDHVAGGSLAYQRHRRAAEPIGLLNQSQERIYMARHTEPCGLWLKFSSRAGRRLMGIGNPPEGLTGLA